MLNFTVGPVMSSDAVRAIGAEQIPYFRTEEFSELMLENEGLIKKFAMASEKSRVVFITGSNGGRFGHRFDELLEPQGTYTEMKLKVGKSLKAEQLREYAA